MAQAVKQSPFSLGAVVELVGGLGQLALLAAKAHLWVVQRKKRLEIAEEVVVGVAGADGLEDGDAGQRLLLAEEVAHVASPVQSAFAVQRGKY